MNKSTLLNLLLKAPSYKLRNTALNVFGVSKQKNLILDKGIYIQDYRKLQIGDNTHINSNTFFYTGVNNASSITIGCNVNIAMETVFCTVTHEIGTYDRRAGNNISKSIIVEDGVWIGANSTILPGVTIGKGCIVQAGSVVTKSCKPNCIYGGNPAKMIMDLSKIQALG